MKSTLFLGAILLLFAASPHDSAAQQRDLTPFRHLALSANVGTTGFGLQAATPLNSHFAVRAGFSMLPATVSYTYKGTGDNGDLFSIPMDAKVEMFNGKILLDFFPVKDSRFHLTGGIFFGGSQLLSVTGHTTYKEEIQIGDIWIRPDEYGSVSAWIESNAVKPYLGIGFGRTIPRTRVGFKFEMGGLFQGSPKIVTSNPIVNTGLNRPEADDLNRYLDHYFQIYPYLSFQLSYRIF